MKKVIGIVLLVFAGTVMLNGLIPKNIENSLEKEEKKELPVVESTALYEEFTLPSLTEKATYVIQAKVMEVGDTLMKEKAFSLTEDPKEATEIISYPVTPITLKVNNVMKGEDIAAGDTFVYYEDGGRTPDYIQLRDGFLMEEGMDIILFLDKEGYCWGYQSMFPVVNDQVLLNEVALDYVNPDKVSEMDTKKMKSVFKEQINHSVSTFMQVEDFANVIKALQN